MLKKTFLFVVLFFVYTVMCVISIATILAVLTQNLTVGGLLSAILSLVLLSALGMEVSDILKGEIK